MRLVFFLFVILILSSFVSADSNDGFIIVEIPGGECSYTFVEGWNFISFCSELIENELTAILNEIDGQYRYVMEWDKITQEFKIYSPKAATNPFTTFDDDKSYFIYIKGDALALDVHGDEAGDESRYFVKGWTTLGYPYRSTKLLGEIIPDYETKMRYAMKWNFVNQEFDIFSPKAATNPFDSFSIGEGGFIYLYEDNVVELQR